MTVDGLFFSLAPHANAMLLSAALMLLAYAAIMTEWVNRALAAMLAAGVAIALGLLSQQDAIAAIDFNTLALLVGTMLIVGVSRRSGLFGYLAVRAAQAARGHPAGILVALALVTGLASAVLNNVTTVLLTVPVTLVICSELRVHPYPFLFAEIFASNIGGSATLIGDPPNILIGSAAGLGFNEFFLALAPVAAVVFVLQTVATHLLWGSRMRADAEHRARIMALKAAESIEDRYLLSCSVAVLAGVILALIFAAPLGLEAGTIALLGAAILMALECFAINRAGHAAAVARAFGDVEWVTIFFFIGLFVIVGAVEKAGLIDLLGRQLVGATGGNPRAMALSMLWAAAILSALIDNIPFVATMIPLVKGLAPAMGGDAALLPIWWSLALGACLGGNGTLIGASANLTVAGLAERNGIPFGFRSFTMTAFPLMLLSIAICHLYVIWRFF